MAGLKTTIFFASPEPHTLLALAEAGHGIAIVPSQLQCNRKGSGVKTEPLSSKSKLD